MNKLNRSELLFVLVGPNAELTGAARHEQEQKA